MSDQSEKLKNLFPSMSDEELIQGIKEIKEDTARGLICDGVQRKYAAILGAICGNGTSLNLMHSQMSITQEAAFRWLNSIESNLVTIENAFSAGVSSCVDIYVRCSGELDYDQIEIDKAEYLLKFIK